MEGDALLVLDQQPIEKESGNFDLTDDAPVHGKQETSNPQSRFPSALSFDQLTLYHHRIDSTNKEPFFEDNRRGWSCRSAPLSTGKLLHEILNSLLN